MINKNSISTCTRCLMDTSDTLYINFNNEGICNYCNYYDTEFKKLGTPEKRKIFLEKKISEIKEYSKNKKYDCLLGVSGGVDSSYLAWWCKENNLRPLVVHFDNGWNSEIATKNIENICKTLNYDLNTYVIPWEEFKELQKAYIKANVVDIEVLTDHAIHATLTKISKKEKIKYILSGFNLATEAIMPKGWVFDKTDWENIKDIHSKFGTGKSIRNFPHISFRQKLINHWILKIEPIQVLNYIDYNKAEAKKIITEKLGWKDYGGKHYESVFTKFYQGYILIKKFGIDKRKAHLSTLICSGQITKEKALKELEDLPYNENTIEEEISYVLKKLEITRDEFEKYLIEPERLHQDFKTEKELWRKYFKLINILKFKWK